MSRFRIMAMQLSSRSEHVLAAKSHFPDARVYPQGPDAAWREDTVPYEITVISTSDTLKSTSVLLKQMVWRNRPVASPNALLAIDLPDEMILAIARARGLKIGGEG